ncbi:MAG: VanW family protein [Oscillospiraceae bacterium]|jgi:vancomycin resistance protein YoaR|nr:VanW family protein [Oscillospiraceae bacterium]
MSAKNTKTKAAPAAAARGKKVSRGRVVGIAAIAVVAILIVTFIGTGVYASAMDTIYPHVRVAGIDLTGLTVEEAELRLVSAGYQSSVERVAATVKLPNDSAIAITGTEAGLSPNARIAAERAFAHGRDGGFFKKEIALLGSVLSPTVIDDSDIVQLDEAAVREAVAGPVQQFNESLVSGSYTVETDRIEIIKGAGTTAADANAVFELAVKSLYESLDTKSPVAAEYTLPEGEHNTEADLLTIYNEINSEPVEARYDTETKTVTQSATGTSFDMESAKRLVDEAGMGETVTIPLILTEPEVSTESLNAMLFRDILAERTTDIAGTSNRLNNVTLAAAACADLVLNPGEEFSFNGTVGQRTTARGYKEAGAYSGGRTVQEIGGGICQVSSTIYDCVLHADLLVTDRSNHMFIVTYLPVGNDATVNWGTIDFKFKNSTEFPMRVETVVDGRKLTVRLVGTKTSDLRVETDYVTISSKDYGVERIEDPSIAPGTEKVDTEGHKSYVVETYKYYYDADGNLVDKVLAAKSSYRAQNRIILVPVGSLNPTDPGTEVVATDSPDASPTPTVSPAEPMPTPETWNPDESEQPNEPEQPSETEQPAETETEPPTEPPTDDVPDAEPIPPTNPPIEMYA